jgi:cytochrome c-type biogenesis protein CcmH/NrfG
MLKYFSAKSHPFLGMGAQVADGVLMASARVASKMEAQSAAAQARTPPNQNPRPVSHVVMMAASGARQGANALAYMADKVRLSCCVAHAVRC